MSCTQFEIGELLHDVCGCMLNYLDGDLKAAYSLPHQRMNLEDELELEEYSEWAGKTLGKSASVKDEERWREIIATMLENETMPEQVRADKLFLGGKQFHRATELLMAAMRGKRHGLKNRLLSIPILTSMFVPPLSQMRFPTFLR